jgi:hypothetical protein
MMAGHVDHQTAEAGRGGFPPDSQRGKRTMTSLNRSRGETLLYVQSLLGQLRTMAEAERCDMLAYLIEMAYVEASDIVRGERPSRAFEQKRHSAA